MGEGKNTHCSPAYLQLLIFFLSPHRKVSVDKERLEYLTYQAMEVLGCRAWDVSIW